MTTFSAMPTSCKKTSVAFWEEEAVRIVYQNGQPLRPDPTLQL
jgi:hypothetical protein